jgi:hypothetical protein
VAERHAVVVIPLQQSAVPYWMPIVPTDAEVPSGVEEPDQATNISATSEPLVELSRLRAVISS